MRGVAEVGLELTLVSISTRRHLWMFWLSCPCNTYVWKVGKKNKWKVKWKQCRDTVVAQRLRAFSLPTIPTLYCHFYTLALLSAYYLLVRLCITLRPLSNVTISTAQYLPIYLYARVLVSLFLCALVPVCLCARLHSILLLPGTTTYSTVMPPHYMH